MIELAFPLALLLAPAPLLVWRFAPPYRQSLPSLRFPFFRQLASAAGIEPRRGSVVVSRTPLQMVAAGVVWALMVLALAQPTRVGEPIVETRAGRDLVLAIDISGSMDERDFKDASGAPAQRLETVKRIAGDFIERREGDRIALIVFGTRAYLQTPFTEDLSTVREMLEQIEVGMAGPHTALGDSIGLAIRTFESSALKQRLLILLSDGADTGSFMSPINAAAIAAENGVEIHTVGVGRRDGRGENRLDADALQSIAEKAQGRFYFAEDAAALTTIYARIDGLAPRATETVSHRPRQTLGHWPLALAAILALLVAVWPVAAARLGARA